ncbi:hypothetical protein AZF37_02345 [endosymbiont 'TC1' of Trimyema compressum]|uniref:tetratricopeptide repeat protein n=1 Tax=endosymbiont 'TC1' of Trimyema compressum TaxID=243899 RepID=UPI0007F09BE4|nr:hypothetical protein [endosymbiont 'TC1' of Trimyema compressum]AMP20164.1 hypothetical protein AZF37_02345 [endosymbiont 'TC1' of Trimyema compressum]
MSVSNNKRKRIIQIFAIGMALIFFAGILMGAIGCMAMPKKTPQTANTQPSNYENLAASDGDLEATLNAINQYQNNINENPESVPDLIGIAQKYTLLASTYEKQGNMELRNDAYNKSIPFYVLIGEKSPETKIAADYRIAEAYGKVGNLEEAEVRYQKLLETEVASDQVSIYLTYGSFLRNDKKDEAGAQVYFDKALEASKTDDQKKQVQTMIDTIKSK